jgi:hypothetical protein
MLSDVNLRNSKRIEKKQFGDLRKWPAHIAVPSMYNLGDLRTTA